MTISLQKLCSASARMADDLEKRVDGRQLSSSNRVILLQ
jgi:hypothetical protein